MGGVFGLRGPGPFCGEPDGRWVLHRVHVVWRSVCLRISITYCRSMWAYSQGYFGKGERGALRVLAACAVPQE